MFDTLKRFRSWLSRREAQEDAILRGLNSVIFTTTQATAFLADIRTLGAKTLEELRMTHQAVKDVQDAMAEENDKIDKAIAMIEGFAQAVEDNKEDADALTQIAASMREKSQALAAAVAGPAPVDNAGGDAQV